MAILSDSEALEARQAFGSAATAMVTPMHADGAIDWDSVNALATGLVDGGMDSLIVSGTTGESPTTTDAEKSRLITEVIATVGDRARVLTGVGTNNTAHSIELAHAAKEAGAHGLLLVTPYYSKPTQRAIIAHMLAVADSTDLPVMLYDIPGRSSVPLTTETLIELSAHPRILAVKDAKADLEASMNVMHRSSLAYYSGDDALTLPLMAAGAVGVVSTIGNVAPAQVATLVRTLHEGDIDQARRLAAGLLPLTDTIMNHMPGAVAVKAALDVLGVIPTSAVRLPQLPADDEQVGFLRQRLEESGYIQ